MYIQNISSIYINLGLKYNYLFYRINYICYFLIDYNNLNN